LKCCHWRSRLSCLLLGFWRCIPFKSLVKRATPYSTVQFWGYLEAQFAGKDPDYYEEHDDARRHTALADPEDNSETHFGISWSHTTAWTSPQAIFFLRFTERTHLLRPSLGVVEAKHKVRLRLRNSRRIIRQLVFRSWWNDKTTVLVLILYVLCMTSNSTCLTNYSCTS